MSLSAQQVYEYLLMKGLSPSAAAGVTNNAIAESGAGRDSFAMDVLNFNRRGDQGRSHGMFQHLGGRADNLKHYLNSVGAERGTDSWWQGQVDFALEEMNPHSPYADKTAAANRDTILNAANPRDATLAFSRYFERNDPKYTNKRIGLANIDMGGGIANLGYEGGIEGYKAQQGMPGWEGMAQFATGPNPTMVRSQQTTPSGQLFASMMGAMQQPKNPEEVHAPPAPQSPRIPMDEDAITTRHFITPEERRLLGQRRRAY